VPCPGLQNCSIPRHLPHGRLSQLLTDEKTKQMVLLRGRSPSCRISRVVQVLSGPILNEELLICLDVRQLAISSALPHSSAPTRCLDSVDFKTDREFGAASARYVAQVRLYSEAIAAATRLPTKGILLVV
jgi:hypothetical protein